VPWATLLAGGGLRADAFVAFADDALARAGARTAAAATASDAVGGPSDGGPFAGVLTGTTTGADVLRAQNSGGASAGHRSSPDAAVPQVRLLLSAEARARLALLRSHRLRTTRRLKRQAQRGARGSLGAAAPVSVSGFSDGQLRAVQTSGGSSSSSVSDEEDEEGDESDGDSNGADEEASVSRGREDSAEYEDDEGDATIARAEGALAIDADAAEFDARFFPDARDDGGGFGRTEDDAELAEQVVSDANLKSYFTDVSDRFRLRDFLYLHVLL
jgi:hypothetical protein